MMNILRAFLNLFCADLRQSCEKSEFSCLQLPQQHGVVSLAQPGPFGRADEETKARDQLKT
jgi:hypothetical protein